MDMLFQDVGQNTSTSKKWSDENSSRPTSLQWRSRMDGFSLERESKCKILPKKTLGCIAEDLHLDKEESTTGSNTPEIPKQTSTAIHELIIREVIETLVKI